MKNPSKWILYAVYILAIAGILLYSRFPADTVSGYLLFHAKNLFPGCNAVIGDIKPAFPPGLKLSRVNILWQNRSLLNIDQAVVAPGYLSILKDHKVLHIAAKAYGGAIKARITAGGDESARPVSAHAVIEDISLEKIAWLKSISNRDLSGFLEGKIDYNRQSPEEPLRSSLTFTDLTIEMLVPVFNMESFDFKSVETDIVVNNQKVLVTRCVLRGQKVDGNLTGSVSLKEPIEKSTFNLSGTLKIHPAFMAYLKKHLPASLLPKKKSGDNSFPIRFFGTLDKPGFSLK